MSFASLLVSFPGVAWPAPSKTGNRHRPRMNESAGFCDLPIVKPSQSQVHAHVIGEYCSLANSYSPWSWCINRMFPQGRSRDRFDVDMQLWSRVMEALFTVRPIRPSRPRILFPPLDACMRLPGSRTNNGG